MAAEKNGWLTKWLLGISASIVILGGSGWVSWIAVYTDRNSSRITIIETNYANIKEVLVEIKNDVKDIKNKVGN